MCSEIVWVALFIWSWSWNQVSLVIWKKEKVVEKIEIRESRKKRKWKKERRESEVAEYIFRVGGGGKREWILIYWSRGNHFFLFRLISFSVHDPFFFLFFYRLLLFLSFAFFLIFLLSSSLSLSLPRLSFAFYSFSLLYFVRSCWKIWSRNATRNLWLVTCDL